jgi:hypothetical protein
MDLSLANIVCCVGSGLCDGPIPSPEKSYGFLSLANVARWLRYCTTNRKVAGSIPDGVIGIFH